MFIGSNSVEIVEPVTSVDTNIFTVSSTATWMAM